MDNGKTYHDRNIDCAWSVKVSSCCEECGEARPEVLAFHHRDPSQKIMGISGWNGSLSRLKTEIAKCSILCHNCHAYFHYWNKDARLDSAEPVVNIWDSNLGKSLKIG